MTLNDLLDAGFTLDTLRRLVSDSPVEDVADTIYDDWFYGMNCCDPVDIENILRNLP